jgi:hypothetical protein
VIAAMLTYSLAESSMIALVLYKILRGYSLNSRMLSLCPEQTILCPLQHACLSFLFERAGKKK